MEAAYETVRSRVASRSADRLFAPEIEAVAELVETGAFDPLVDSTFPGRSAR